MYHLDKCANCERYGSVALKPTDKLCNLCSVTKKEVTVEVKLKKNRDENGHFVKKEDKE